MGLSRLISEHVRVLVKVEALGEVISESKDISVNVPEWRKDALITWAYTALAAMLLPIIASVLSAIIPAILSPIAMRLHYSYDHRLKEKYLK